MGYFQSLAGGEVHARARWSDHGWFPHGVRFLARLARWVLTDRSANVNFIKPISVNAAQPAEKKRAAKAAADKAVPGPVDEPVTEKKAKIECADSVSRFIQRSRAKRQRLGGISTRQDYSVCMGGWKRAHHVRARRGRSAGVVRQTPLKASKSWPRKPRR